MRNLASILILVALAAPAIADLEDDVRCREVGFSKSVENQDHDLFASFIDPDARFVGGTVTRGRDAVAEAWKVFFSGDLPTIRWRPAIVEILESGDLALSRGPYRVLDKNDQGETTESWGTFNSVWRLNGDGEWLVVFDAGSPSSEPPGEAQRQLLESDAGCE
jgi:ketosteroid isomerase-like protein